VEDSSGTRIPSAARIDAAEWLEALSGPDPSTRHLEELGAFLRGTLARVLGAGRRYGPVSDGDLEDFTQEALLRILRGLGGFRGTSKFTTWAAAVAVRVAFSELRRRRYREGSLDELDLSALDALPSAGGDPERIAGRRDLLADLRRAIDERLTEKQRHAIAGELAGVPTVELAPRLGTNPNALYKLVHDARRRLRAALEEAGYDADDVRRELAEASRGEE